MQNCPYCNAPLNEKYNFCINCDRQIKCVHCNDFLIPNKIRCYMCGKPIENEATSPSVMNEFNLEEKHTRSSSSRSLKGRFSDVAFGQAAALFGGLPVPKPLLVRNTNAKQQPLYEQPTLPHFEETPNVIIGEPPERSEHAPSTPPIAQQPSDKIARYFEQDGADSLVCLVADYKGETKKDQQQRFILLYIYAYHQFFNHPLPEQKYVIKALQNRNMFDNNVYKHFPSVESRYLIKVEAGYRVNTDGVKEIERIISEIEDETKKGFVDWDKPGKPRAKQSRLNSQYEQQLDLWVDLDTGINNFDIRSLKRATNYAMFSLFILTKKLNVTRAVQPILIFQYLKRKFSSIPVSQKSIANALKRPYNAKFFEKTADGSFYLTVEGESKIRGWLQSGKVDEVDTENTEDEDSGENEEGEEE